MASVTVAFSTLVAGVKARGVGGERVLYRGRSEYVDTAAAIEGRAPKEEPQAGEQRPCARRRVAQTNKAICKGFQSSFPCLGNCFWSHRNYESCEARWRLLHWPSNRAQPGSRPASVVIGMKFTECDDVTSLHLLSQYILKHV